MNADTPIQAGLCCLKRHIGLKQLVGLSITGADHVSQVLARQSAEAQLDMLAQAIESIDREPDDITGPDILAALEELVRGMKPHYR
jgi:hypothetical protein